MYVTRSLGVHPARSKNQNAGLRFGQSKVGVLRIQIRRHWLKTAQAGASNSCTCDLAVTRNPELLGLGCSQNRINLK